RPDGQPLGRGPDAGDPRRGRGALHLHERRSLCGRRLRGGVERSAARPTAGAVRMSLTESFFARGDDGSLVPRAHARSPGSADMMHGRLLAGLAARHVEQHHLDDGMRAARLTIDLFRSPAMEPVVETSRVLRAGRRIKVVEVVQSIAETEVARAVVVLMRTGPHPDGAVWAPPPWDAPAPDDVPAPPDSPMRQLTSMEVRAID